MYIYNFTLQKPTTIVQAVHGNFSGAKQQEIIVNRGRSLELLKPDPVTGKVYTVLSSDSFGIIRSVVPFRLTGSSKDYLVVGSDSGRIAILEYNPTKNVMERVHLETFGKSGCRRIVPGQYLAVDPKGRAIMIGAMEKQKFVYIMNRDPQARLTISSPLEAHKSNTLMFHMVAVDVGFENPCFACLEIDYEEADNDATGEAAMKTKQTLTFYELDLGLNHVVRKYAEELNEMAVSLIPVPGGNDGPSGVLVCSENYITYRNLGDQPQIRMPIPRRRNDLDDPERGIIIVASATHKTRSMFFFLIQTEQGDLFKMTLETDEDMVTEIRLKYFDTVPVATSMCVLKTGFLFVASEFGNHYLYQIARLGDDEDEPEFSSSVPLEEGDTFFFSPRELRNLVQVDEMDSLAPIMSCQIADLAAEDSTQLYVLCGRGPRSSLRVLRHGLEVSEMAVSELPGNPNAVWTVKRSLDDQFDAYIVVSFVNATLVLSIGETVEEVTDSGFLGTTPTLACSLLGSDALVQIYPDGIRHIRPDKRVNEWKTPGKRSIVKCAINRRQVVIALMGGELVYFEMDPSGQLNEYTERKEMGNDVVCMALGEVPAGEQRSRFLAVGLATNTVHVISLHPKDCWSPLSMQALPAQPESLCIVQMGGPSKGMPEDLAAPKTSALYLNIGLQNGVLLRTVLDQVTGDLSDTRTRYLGARPVRLFPIVIQGSQAVLAMSSRSWLLYWHQNRFHVTPLSYESLEYASGFSSEQCPEGIVTISANTLRILALEKLGAVFNQVSVPLQLTPRKFAIHQQTGNLVILETDHNAYTEQTKQQRKRQMAEEMVQAAGDDERQLAGEMAAQFLQEHLPDDKFGAPKAGRAMWASMLRIMHPVNGKTLFKHEFQQGEAAHSLAFVRFAARPDQQYLLVGVVQDLVLNPRHSSGGSIYTFQLTGSGAALNAAPGAAFGLHLLHRTPVEDMPGAICSFQGRVLIGVGRLLRLYDLGKKRLLKKIENKWLPQNIMQIQTMGSRIYVSDVQESVHFIKYRPEAKENQLAIFADDAGSRYMTACCLLDYDTICGGDKFGNVFVLRLPYGVNEQIEEDPTGTRSLWDRGMIVGASQKAEELCNFYVGETITSLQKTTLIPGGSELVVYTTLSGTIGCLVPFSSSQDHDFFQNLEMHMRQEAAPLCGRDHLAYRSYYHPCKSCIDGDLCEQFSSMDTKKQVDIAHELDRKPNEVSKKLEDIRTRFAF